ncbi:DsbA family oxidoreductase [Salinimonas sediminis]|uniref:DsbA family oxidoreductase n=1 Tax=Salinimonas sediminis TaxID=2303538 RepID=A0A346NN69_9ALTE|nr:DsbA family oxidoreductase [Salinimonas sediminis]AXR06976.1 DsbA family oxidoreductase [Salinimonas sediminis]
MTDITIDLVSDVACPWCAIGYGRLQQALEQLPEVSTTLTWRAFELNPDPDATPEPIVPALCRKYGATEEQINDSQRQMMTIASELGLHFDKMESRYTANTFDAHRLVKWAATHNSQTPMKLALFDAYFGDAKPVGEHSVLLDCVKAAGLDTEQAKQVLDSDQFGDDVRREEQQYQQAGVSSVPAFIINNKYLISGAQEPDELAQAIRQIASENP